MQGESGRQRELLDVESIAGHLLPAGSVFAFLAEHRHRLFPAEVFADLFPFWSWTAVGPGGCDRLGDLAADPARLLRS